MRVETSTMLAPLIIPSSVDLSPVHPRDGHGQLLVEIIKSDCRKLDHLASNKELRHQKKVTMR